MVGLQGSKPVTLTLAERQTRKSIYVLVKNKTQKEVLQAVRRAHRRVKGDFTQVFKALRQTMVQSFWIAKGCKRRQSAMKCTTHILGKQFLVLVVLCYAVHSRSLHGMFCWHLKLY